MDDSKRLKILRINRELLAGLFRQDANRQLVFEGMPEDAKLVGISEHAYFAYDEVALKFWSATFEMVADSREIPLLNVTVREIRPENSCHNREYNPAVTEYRENMLGLGPLKNRYKGLMSELILPPTYPEYYRGACGKPYQPQGRYGYTSIPVLQFLWGQKWDDLALNYVRALRPSSLRVTYGEETTDARPWRVTVRVDKEDNRIIDMDQEVEVGLAPDFQHGHALNLELKRRAQKP